MHTNQNNRAEIRWTGSRSFAQ